MKLIDVSAPVPPSRVSHDEPTADVPTCPDCGTPLYAVPGPRNAPPMLVCPNRRCGNVSGYVVGDDGELIVVTDIAF